jgi:hypothetical protein
MKIKITEWINEDELTEDIMYNTLFELSKVDGVRIFPKKIEIGKEERVKFKREYDEVDINGINKLEN